MDGKLAEMLARRKREQEEAEEEEWMPSSAIKKDKPQVKQVAESTATAASEISQHTASPSTSAESGACDMEDGDVTKPAPSTTTAAAESLNLGDLLDAQDLADCRGLIDMDEAEPAPEPLAQTAIINDGPSETSEKETREIDCLQELPSSGNDLLEEFGFASASNPAESAGQSSISSELPAQSVQPSSSSEPPAQSVQPKPTPQKKSKLPQMKAKATAAKAAAAGEAARTQSGGALAPAPQPSPAAVSAADRSTAFAYKMSAGQDPVPVLVIPTQDAANWRQGAQNVSSAYNTMQNVSRVPPPMFSSPGKVTGATQQSFKGAPPAPTLASAQSKVVASLAAPSIGTGSIFRDTPSNIRNLQIGSPRGHAGEHGDEKSTSVPATARSNLLDNNVLALSTGTVEERAEAARRICKRAKTCGEVDELVQAGVVGAIGPLLADQRAVDAGIEALLRLCSGIKEGGSEGDRRVKALNLSAALEENGVAERVAALICWESRDEQLKGRMALLIFHMAQNHNLANRVLVQDGAIKALIHLLDSPHESAASSAAAALANISYWSTEPAPRYSHMKILCAL